MLIVGDTGCGWQLCCNAYVRGVKMAPVKPKNLGFCPPTARHRIVPDYEREQESSGVYIVTGMW